MSDSHGERINELTSEPQLQVCDQNHPLLSDVRCQRLKGHPGQHGAAYDDSSAEMTMQWPEDFEAEQEDEAEDEAE